MKNISTAILHQLSAALFDKDFFRVGYLLMALSESSESATVLKDKAVSWLSVEILASVPHDTRQCDDMRVSCVDGSGAIVSFVSTCLDGNTNPSQYLEKLRTTGRYIIDHFAPVECGTSTLEKQGVIDAYQHSVRAIEPYCGPILTSCKTNVLILPARGVDYSGCVWTMNERSRKYVAAIPLQNPTGLCASDVVREVVATMLVYRAYAEGVNIPQVRGGSQKTPHTRPPGIDVIGGWNPRVLLPNMAAARRLLQVSSTATSEFDRYK